MRDYRRNSSVQRYAKDGDDTAWRATRHSWSGDIWGHGLWERRAITDKGEMQRQRKLSRVGLRGPAISTTDSRGDVRSRLPWIALASLILNPDLPSKTVHDALRYELLLGDRGRQQARYERGRKPT